MTLELLNQYVMPINRKMKKKLKVPKVPPRVLIDFATKCNLRCPMCVVWGSEEERKIDEVKGVMNLKNARKFLDEISKYSIKPLIQPNLWGEPLLIPNLSEVLDDIKSRKLPIVFNTNGLTLNEKNAKMIVKKKIETVMFSVDAVTPKTLKKVRGIDKLEKIEKNVMNLVKIRGSRKLPRIGVTFTLQDANKKEQDKFVKRWLGKVDFIRIGLVFDEKSGEFSDLNVKKITRKPCPSLYTTLPVHNDGTVRLCCLDGFRVTNMGNVFKDGLEKVWHGKEFTKAREHHEKGEWDKVPFCKNCNGWAEYDYEEKVIDGHLVRSSPQYIYYNKIDKIKNWSKNFRGGHKISLDEKA